MSQLKLVLHRSLKGRKLGYWESPGVVLGGTKSEDTVALDKSFASLVEAHDRIAATLNPEWVELTRRFDTLVDRMAALATAEVDNKPKARQDHTALIDAEIEIAEKLEIDTGLEVERQRLLAAEVRRSEVERARQEEEQLRVEEEREQLAEVSRRAQEEREAEVERTRLAELGRQTEQERAEREEERRPTKELRAKFDGVAAKLIATLQRLNSADFASWPKTAGLKVTLAGYRSSLKASLMQGHREIANQALAIGAKMDEALTWANERTAELNVLLARKTELTEALQAEIDKAEKVAARGDLADRDEVAAEVTAVKKTAAEAFALLNLDKVPKSIEQFTKTLKGIADQIAEKFINLGKTLAGIQKGEYARVHAESSKEHQEDLGTSVGKVTTALASGTLIEVDREMTALRSEIANTDSYNQEIKKAKTAYPGIKKLYQSIKKIDPKDLVEETNAKTLATLQKLLEEVWGSLTEAIEDGDWHTASADILGTRFPEMLAQANGLVKQDGDAAEAMKLAEEEAAELQKQAVIAAQLAAEQLARTAAAQREADKLAGINEGDRLFLTHGNPIISYVWRETKKHAPHSQNCGIGGTYSYTDIMAAIGVWRGRVDVGLFNSIHVPGGGAIQDKREKNPARNEIQANFISDWDGNPINVHVNLRASDWSIIRP